MTSQGSAHARFERFIRAGNIHHADMAARELGHLTLGDALALTLLYSTQLVFAALEAFGQGSPVALGLILGLRFFAPRVPGALVLVVAGLLATWLFDLGAHGVALVGDVPRGLPAPALPGWDIFQQHYSVILAAAAGLLLIGFSQTAGDARAFAVRHRYRIDVNQESVAQGMANMAAGAFQGTGAAKL